jgi:hypothetical protein
MGFTMAATMDVRPPPLVFTIIFLWRFSMFCPVFQKPLQFIPHNIFDQAFHIIGRQIGFQLKYEVFTSLL